MASNIKISDRTGTEQTYNSVPYIKVKDTNNTDQIFINTSDADISASDVTVGKTAYGSGGSLIQGAYESSGGVIINGVINAYEVDAGQNINAGDFISFVNEMVQLNKTSPQGIAAQSGVAGDTINCYAPV